MTHTAYDAADFARFDLANGTISSPENRQLALMPLDLIAQMAPTPGLRKSALNWGQSQAKLLKVNTSDLNMDDLAKSLQTSISLIGFGKISIEIYNDALLFRLKTPDIYMSGTIKNIVLGFLTGYLKELKPDADFETELVDDKNNEYLIFAGNKSAVDQLVSWISQGTTPIEAIARLNQKGGN